MKTRVICALLSVPVVWLGGVFMFLDWGWITAVEPGQRFVALLSGVLVGGITLTCPNWRSVGDDIRQNWEA